MNTERLNGCVYNIQDKLDAIKSELMKPNPYPGYIKEKAQPILNDIQVILSDIEQ